MSALPTCCKMPWVGATILPSCIYHLVGLWGPDLFLKGAHCTMIVWYRKIDQVQLTSVCHSPVQCKKQNLLCVGFVGK